MEVRRTDLFNGTNRRPLRRMAGERRLVLFYFLKYGRSSVPSGRPVSFKFPKYRLPKMLPNQEHLPGDEQSLFWCKKSPRYLLCKTRPDLHPKALRATAAQRSQSLNGVFFLLPTAPTPDCPLCSVQTGLACQSAVPARHNQPLANPRLPPPGRLKFAAAVFGCSSASA